MALCFRMFAGSMSERQAKESPSEFFNSTGAIDLPDTNRLAPYTPKGNVRRLRMLNKTTVLTVIICLTVLAFVWLERDRLCDFRIKTKMLEVDAGLSYELNR